jgi:hypothetical protein
MGRFRTFHLEQGFSAPLFAFGIKWRNLPQAPSFFCLVYALVILILRVSSLKCRLDGVQLEQDQA